VVVFCFLSVDLGWANASGAITKQPSVTIIFFMFVSYVNDVLLGKRLERVRMEQEPLRAFPTTHFARVGKAKPRKRPRR
jgi:hypothetical protein